MIFVTRVDPQNDWVDYEDEELHCELARVWVPELCNTPGLEYLADEYLGFDVFWVLPVQTRRSR